MSAKEKIRREDLKQQYPDVYQAFLDYQEFGPLKEQAILQFDITRSAKRGNVRIIRAYYSGLKTMFCDECESEYSENEYASAVRQGYSPCGHNIMDCYNIESVVKE